MADRGRHLNSMESGAPAPGAPAYATIANQIRRGIEAKSLPRGLVLLEGPLAALFGSSRSPVKQALSRLEEEGLLSRFDGRGLLVGKGNPLRVKITPQMLQLSAEAGINPRSFAWQPLYYEFEREIILRSVFGWARLNELALARHLNVGRTVAHDLLVQAREAGIVTKDERSRWWIVPLDEARFRDLYELRILLEPAALRHAIGRIPGAWLDEVEERLRQVTETFPDVTGPDLDRLESDLHVDCLGYGENVELLEALRRTRCILVAGKHIQMALQRKTKVDPFMEEHLEIVSALRRHDARAACKALVRHLEMSAEKAEQRLASFRRTQAMHELPYAQA
ncbi:GntR family transcriptional regulator [Enterovirga sp.]|uniref:GntR family transcriptional regulator n=1 Tax=Enterovirga sp. TaxID=2026350 RepID=UPI002B56C06B|nr:GntR family transcriptional regulator [Enterovirga sp.]HMO30865.1 GntR family transcriptional regulator [Enterovirga sp.]